MPKIDVAEMSEEALSVLNQTVRGKRYKTLSGEVVVVDPELHLRVCMWAAQQREKKPKILDSPDDLIVPETARRAGE